MPQLSYVQKASYSLTDLQLGNQLQSRLSVSCLYWHVPFPMYINGHVISVFRFCIMDGDLCINDTDLNIFLYRNNFCFKSKTY